MFEAELRHIKLPADADWREELHAYGKAIRDGVVQLGAIGPHFRLSGGAGSMMLPWAERVLQALVNAGFSVDEAGSTLTLVASVAISAGRDAETRVHPHLPEVARALQNQHTSDFPVLNQVIAAREIQTPLERDFEFDLLVIVAGLESLLAGRPQT
jgi:hypothetical protein